MQYVEYGTQNRETVILLHGGGLSWWNYREAAQLLADRFHVVLPILDGHAGSGVSFVSIEKNAARTISFIDEHFGGKVLTLGGLSLGGQIVIEILSQRPDICRFALIESALAKPTKLTHRLIRPAFGMSYGLVSKRWFAKLQAAYLGLPDKLFDDYYRDTCKISKEDMIAFLECSSAYCLKPSLRDTRAKVHIVFGSKEKVSIRASGNLLHEMIFNSTLECLSDFRHGELSLCRPEQYTRILLEQSSCCAASPSASIPSLSGAELPTT